MASSQLTVGRQLDVPPDDDFRPASAWASVGILMLFSLFSIMDRQIISLMVDPIKRDLGLSDTQLGLLQGLAFAFCYALAGLPLGWAVDRFSRRAVVFFGVVTWSITTVFCGLARNFTQLFLGRACVGVGEASLGPTAVSLISDLFPKDKLATPLGVYSAGFYLGSGVALAVGGWIVSLFLSQPFVAMPLVGNIASWQAVFIVTGLPGLPVAILAFLLRDPRPSAKISGVDAVVAGFWTFLRLRGPLIAIVIAGFSAATFVAYAWSAWTPTYFIRVHGWSAQKIGWAYGLCTALSGTIGALSGGVIIDRVYRAGRQDATMLVAAYATLFSILPLVAGYLVTSSLLALLLICLGQIIISTVSGASYAVWQKVAPPRFRGRLAALYIMCAAMIGTSFGPVAVGAITDHVFGDPMAVGRSIALVLGVTLPFMTVLFFWGAARLRYLPEWTEPNQA